jgi:septal ring factor EnvC (AmiA/AmiB activator)
MKAKFTLKQLKSMKTNIRKTQKLIARLEREIDRTYDTLTDQSDKFADHWHWLESIENQTPKQKKEQKVVTKYLDALDRVQDAVHGDY